MRLRKLIVFIFIPFLFLLTSCWDLGNYENDKDYTDSFEVYVINSVNDTKKYDMEDFYNEDAVNDYKLPEDFEADEYKYLALKVNKETLKVGQIYISIKAEEAKTITVKLTVLDSLPTSICDPNMDLKKLENYLEEKKENPEAVFNPIVSDEPTEYIASSYVTLKSGKYDAIAFDTYQNKDYLDINENQYLFFEFHNNTETGIEIKEDSDPELIKEEIEKRTKNKVKISFTCILIEAK